MTQAANLLGAEQSPYLLQHADNPVHWRPWGQAALAEAAAGNRPILLSIGYAACHWCHVMAHESFENEATAALMNRLFVSVKVDREERPDIDHLYMSALHAMGQQGGWPLTMFLAPDGMPFWGGTYFPPDARFGRPGFRQVLTAVAEAWEAGGEAIAQNRAALAQALERQSQSQPGALPAPALLDDVARSYLNIVDRDLGGLQGAPKFPNPPIFRFLWLQALRGAVPEGREAVQHLLRAMSQGGIYDHLGGGYARYSTDAEWLVPHFEKMLYDNAQILELLSLAQADRPDPLLAERAAETVGWMLRDMRTGTADAPDAFAASEDADSEGVEGKFYVWTAAEIAEVLGPDAPPFMQAYDVTEEGNWEDHTILRRVTSRGDAAAEAALAASRARLLAVRDGRIRPGRDDKVLADWNGLAIAALARAAIAFDQPAWRAAAGRAYAFLLAHLRAPDGRINHAWRRGQVTAAGLLDDQAAMARAALALFEATGDIARLHEAIDLARAAQAHFADADGSFFTSAADAPDIPVARPRSAADNATPSGNGMMAEVFARLYHLTGAAEWRVAAEAVITAFSGAGRGITGMPGLLAATLLLEEAGLVVVAGAADAADTRALLRTALASPDPTVLVLRAHETAALPVEHPAHGKDPGGLARAYLCRGGVCGAPVQDPASLAALLRRNLG